MWTCEEGGKGVEIGLGGLEGGEVGAREIDGQRNGV